MSSTLAAALARAIAAERSRLGLSQAELGMRLGWSRDTVARIEGGERQVAAHELVDLCAALECGLLDLMSRANADDKRTLRVSRLYPSDPD